MIWLLVSLWAANAAPKCYLEADIKSAVCWALCRQDGATTGSYTKGSCICGFEKDFKEYTEPVIKILPPRKEVAVETTGQPSNVHFPWPVVYYSDGM